jgi:hypothetical protein
VTPILKEYHYQQQTLHDGTYLFVCIIAMGRKAEGECNTLNNREKEEKERERESE